MSMGDPHAIPWKELVLPQIFNFSLFVFALIFLLRKPLKNHFSGKLEEFEKSKKLAEEAKVAAERQNAQVKSQLKVLEESASKDIERAKVEAKALHQKILSDAQATATKLEEEAANMAQFELQRAMAMLRSELIQNATKVASDNLKSTIKSDVNEGLTEDFIKNVKAAN